MFSLLSSLKAQTGPASLAVLPAHTIQGLSQEQGPCGAQGPAARAVLHGHGTDPAAEGPMDTVPPAPSHPRRLLRSQGRPDGAGTGLVPGAIPKHWSAEQR